MNHILWLTLFRVFMVCSVFCFILTVVLSIKYRLFSLIRSVADMKKDARKYSDDHREYSVSGKNALTDQDDLPYFAEISDSTSGQVTRKLADPDDGADTGTVILSGAGDSVTELTGADEGNTVVIFYDTGEQTDPDVFVLLKDIRITNGSTEMIKKYR